MRIYKSGEKITGRKTAVALGTFDGLHIAHMRLVNTAEKIAKEQGCSWGVMFFSSIPANSFAGVKTPYIMTAEEKTEILKDADFVYIENFDKSFYEMDVNEFVGYIENVLNGAYVCVGYNYRFAKGASGDAELLKELCAKKGIKVSIISKTEIDGECVSSTKIRSLLADGDAEGAAKFLGRRFFVRGSVIKGFQNGRKMGLPTANVEFDENRAILGFGVYSGSCMVDGREYAAIINVGNNPTFGGKKTTIEAHILDFSQDIYNKTVTVYFNKRIRGDIKFNSPEQLRRQIEKDIEQCRKDMIKSE